MENATLTVSGFTVVGSCITASNAAIFSSESIPSHFTWPTLTLADMINPAENPLGSTISIDDTVEVADLPPPYVPLLIATLILVGVGLLTGSLGDVYTEGKELRFVFLQRL